MADRIRGLIVEACSKRGVGPILTGMGKDGAKRMALTVDAAINR